MMRVAHFRQIAWAAFLVLFALLPFELPAAEAAHGLLVHLLGPVYLLAYVGSALLVCAVLLLVLSPAVESRQPLLTYVTLSAPFLAVGILAVLATAVLQSGDIQLSLQQLVFGFTTPAVLGFVLLYIHPDEREKAWTAFYLGWVLFYLVAAGFLVPSWNASIANAPMFRSSGFGLRLILFRFTMDETWNRFAVFIGNANKTSNYILIFLLLSSRLLQPHRPGRGRYVRVVYHAFWVLSIAMLVLLFSRAALMLLPVVLFVSGYGKRIPRAIWASGAALAGLVVLVNAQWVWPALNYLFTSSLLDDSSQGALGSFNQRFDQWAQISQFVQQHVGVLLTGMGTGWYGLRFFHVPFAGTHNMFLDVLLECGLPGLLLLVLFLGAVALFAFNRAGRLRDSLLLAGTLVLTALMMREHSASYLFVTSLGGFCFTVLAYVAASFPSHLDISARMPAVQTLGR